MRAPLPGNREEGWSYRVLLQLQPLPIGKGGPSLGGVPVGGGGNGSCFLLHSEHLAAGLVFVVRALPGIDDPGEEARELVRVVSGSQRASSSHLAQK